MRITRGFLAPYKSACHLVNYKWRQGKWKCAKLVQNKVMEDTDKAGEISPLQYIHAKKSILGMYLATDGNNKDQFKYIHKKATACINYIRSGGVQ